MELRYRQDIRSPLVEAVWTTPRLSAAIAGPVFPDANQDLLLYQSGDGPLHAAVFGPLSRPLDVTLAPGHAYAGIRFRPGRLPIARLPGLAQARAADLVDERLGVRLPGGLTVHDPLAVVAWLAAPERIPQPSPWPSLMAALQKTRATSVAAFAATAGYSTRQLERICRDHSGLPPKRLLRLLRFQRAYAALQRDPRGDLGALALACGYADHAHMTHDFQSLAVPTPAHIARGMARFDKRILLRAP